MKDWHRKDVGDGISAFAPTAKLHRDFIAMSKTFGFPPNVGVFSRYDLRENMVTWWFSPEASALAKAYDAEPCDKPQPEGEFALAVGDANAMEAHFPGYVARRIREF